MTKEQESILFKDLCARLPYRVKVMGKNMYISSIDAIHNLKFCILVHLTEVNKTLWIEDIKPYLRPMSSMTEEEKEEYDDLLMSVNDGCENTDYMSYSCMEYVDWLNAHHFDYRDLIERGLGIDCTGLNIYENEKST